MRVRILGVGMGPQHLTAEVSDALHTCDYVVAAAKSSEDPLLDVRQAIADAHGVELVAVPDPDRDRSPADYPGAVADWHAARVAAYKTVLAARGGTAAFLVWGDPSLYDSTLRIVEQLASRMPLQYDVLPGISAPQLLAARHRVVLHAVGQPVQVTTGRRLREDIAAGHTNLCVMLNASLDLAGLEDWSIWWGANLGSPWEALVSGRVGEVLGSIVHSRQRAKEDAGWVMDVYLLRAPE